MTISNFEHKHLKSTAADAASASKEGDTLQVPTSTSTQDLAVDADILDPAGMDGAAAVSSGQAMLLLRDDGIIQHFGLRHAAGHQAPDQGSRNTPSATAESHASIHDAGGVDTLRGGAKTDTHDADAAASPAEQAMTSQDAGASTVDATEVALVSDLSVMQTVAPTATLLAVVAPTVLTFDEFGLAAGAEQRLAGTYGGFTWGQTGVYRPSGALGYKPASGSNLAFFGEATGHEVAGYEAAAGSPMVIRLADGGDFSLLSAAFSSAAASSLKITAQAYDDGIQVGSYVFTAMRGVATQVSFEGQARFSSIDELRFDAPNYFGFDNFTVTREAAGAPTSTLAIAAASASKAEGAAGTTTPFTFTVTRAGDTTGAATAAWAVSGSGTSPAIATDFAGTILPTGTVSFAAGETSKTITVNVAGDSTVEASEGFTVTLSSPSAGTTIATAAATGLIQNDDVATTPSSTLAIAAANASKAEGAAGTTTPFTFTVTRAGDTTGAATAAWAVSGSGTSPAIATDFAGTILPTGTVSFAAGETSKTITVNVAGDSTVEASEGFTVTLSSPSAGTTIATAAATGLIQNDDVAAGSGGGGTSSINFSLQNAAGAASKAQYVQFLQVFGQGAVPAGSDLYATVGGQKVPTQMEATQRYADGSVKVAVITLLEPAVAANTTLSGTLTAGQAVTSPDLPANAAIATGYNLAVNMDIQGVGAVRIDAAAELTKAIAAGKAEILMQGPLATEVRVDVYVTSSLHVTLDITTFADGSTATQVQFNNDRAMTSSGGTISYNGISITQDGQTEFSHGALTQYQYQTWKVDVADSASAEPTLNVVHDVEYLERLGAMQNFDLQRPVNPQLLTDEARSLASSSWTNVLGVNDVTQYMPMTGGRPDIGPTTTANALWLITQNPVAATYALGQAEAAGTIPWHFYDPAHGRYLSLDDYPTIWIDYRGGVKPTQMPSDSTGWTTDTAHQPDMSYIAYMLTGERYYLDQLNAQASWAIATTWNVPREDGLGIVANEAEQARAQAWTLRLINEAAYANPDGSEEKAYFTRIAHNNWKHLLDEIPGLTAAQGQIRGILPAVNRADGVAPASQDYFASTAGIAALQGDMEARAVLKWQANFLSGRFLTPDMDPHNGYNYTLNIYDSAGNYLKTWAQVTQALKAAGNYNTEDGGGGFWAELALMSNAALISVFAGGKDPSDHTVAADAMRAYGWLLTSGSPDLRTDLQYQIVPRMPDGTQISAVEMHVTNPTVVGTVQSFTGSNSFTYDVGIGGTTLQAGTSSSVLIDHSRQGGDILVGGPSSDYLIGGVGTNRFAPGGGDDHAVTGSGAAVFDLNPNLQGHLEIDGFRTGIDKLKLLSTTTGTQQIISSAAEDAFGNAVLHISPGYDVTFVGIHLSQLSTAMFL